MVLFISRLIYPDVSTGYQRDFRTAQGQAGKADPRVVAWAEHVPAPSLFLSVITLLELETGVLLIERRDPSQGAILRRWLETQVLPAFSERILAVDTLVARLARGCTCPTRARIVTLSSLQRHWFTI